MLMTILGEDQNQTSTNTTEYEYHVTELLSDGRIKWEMSMTRFIIESDDMQGNVKAFDTQDPDRDTSDKQVQLYDKMVGVPMYMTSKQDGQILEFSGANALFDKIMQAFKDKPEMASMANSIKKTFGDSAMLESVRNMWGYLPAKPVRVGDKWRTIREQSGIMSQTTESVYKLKSRDAHTATIATKSTSKPTPGKSSGWDMGGIKIEYDLSGGGSGSTIVTQPDGILMSGKHSVTMKGMMYMSGDKIDKMDVPITIKVTVLTELIR